MKQVTIVGGGLVGALLTNLMAQSGFKVRMYERRPDIRKADLSAGKSINMAISDRGWRALDIVGLRDEILKMTIPMYGRRMHAMDGEITNQPYGLEGQAIYSISRGGFNAKLLEFAEKAGDVELYFNHRCIDVDFETSIVTLEDTETGKIQTVKSDLIFGADGAFSAVRSAMQKTDRFNYEQMYLPDGYREILLPAGPEGGFKMAKNALHIWPRGRFMLIALPNLNGSYTCTLFMPFEGETSFKSLKNKDDVNRFFAETFPDFYEMMPEVGDEYFNHPLSSLPTIRCYPWVRNNTALIGDASHAIVPFYGQGMNAGFEDCTILNGLMNQHGDNWSLILEAYQKQRKPDGDAIADLAINNYYEMRDHVGDENFLLRKRIEKKIYLKHPNLWMPLYSQVTFSHIRYSQALKTGKHQDRIMDEVMKTDGIHEKWDSDEIETRILSLLDKHLPEEPNRSK